MSALSHYSGHGSNATFDLVEQHAQLVKKIALHLKARLPANVQVDDLIQSGMIGLIEASKNFDASKGASFETFAGIRIRGAMLDEMRRGDWVPRSVHKNQRLVNQAMLDLEKSLGRDAKDHEIAAHLELPLDDYYKMLGDISCGKIVDIDGLSHFDEVLEGQNQGDDNTFDGLEREHFQRALAQGIKGLPEKEALMLALYYEEELNLKEIGEVLNVSESRVSQIHSQAMSRLKMRMQAWQQS